MDLALPIADQPWWNDTTIILALFALGVDILVGGLTFIALVFALYQAGTARRDLVTERRTVFELEILRTLAERIQPVAGKRPDGGVTSYPRDDLGVKTLLLLLPSRELPVWRAVITENRTAIDAAKAALPGYDSSYLFDEDADAMRHEIKAAIAKRVK